MIVHLDDRPRSEFADVARRLTEHDDLVPLGHLRIKNLLEYAASPDYEILIIAGRSYVTPATARRMLGIEQP